MRALIAGQPGTRKAVVANKIALEVLRRRGISETHPASKKEIDVFEVESDQWLGGDFLTFLTNYNEKEQRQRWSAALQRINKRIAQRDLNDAILLVHLTCLRNGHFFSAVSWDDLLQFRPDCIIVLVDDVYDLWDRIEEGPHDTHLSLQEILNWRSVETLYAETLAANLRLDPQKLDNPKIPKPLKQLFGEPLPLFVISVKHPVSMICDLIFERDKKPVVYASFPITRTRGKPERIAEIDSFREMLREAGAIVIDPLAIDELRIEEDSKWLQLREPDNFASYQTLRWKLSDPTVEPVGKYTKSPFQELTDLQILDVKRTILQQVVDRDYRLVGYSEMVIAYRPFYPEAGEAKLGPPPLSSTGGVSREINEALHLGKAVWMFHPRSDFSDTHDKNFFDSVLLWARVNRFPKKSLLTSLSEQDFSGFDDLLADLKKAVKKKAEH